MIRCAVHRARPKKLQQRLECHPQACHGTALMIQRPVHAAKVRDGWRRVSHRAEQPRLVLIAQPDTGDGEYRL